MAGPPVGNRNAVKMKVFDDILRRFLKQEDGRRAQNIVLKMIEMAEDGDRDMIKYVVDRVDGKAIERMEVSDPDGNGVLSGITVTLIRPSLPAHDEPNIVDAEIKEVNS